MPADVLQRDDAMIAEPYSSDMPGHRAGPAPGTGRLFRKYVALFVAVVCVALATNGLFDIWFSYKAQKELLTLIQRAKAESAAFKIGQFIKEIEGQVAWSTHLPWS